MSPPGMVGDTYLRWYVDDAVVHGRLHTQPQGKERTADGLISRAKTLDSFLFRCITAFCYLVRLRTVWRSATGDAYCGEEFSLNNNIRKAFDRFRRKLTNTVGRM
jgi:hypothetical protein